MNGDLQFLALLFLIIFTVIFYNQTTKSKKIIDKAPKEYANNIKISYIPSLAATITVFANLVFMVWLKALEFDLDKWAEYSFLIDTPTSVFYILNKKFNSDYLKLKKIVESIEEYKENKSYDAEIQATKDKINSEKKIISKLNQKLSLSDEEKQIISKIKAKKTREFWFAVGVIILAIGIALMLS